MFTTVEKMHTAAVMLVLAAYLGACEGDSKLLQGPLTGAVGGSVKFITNLKPTQNPFGSVSWSFISSSTLSSVNIITSITTDFTNPGHTNRISLDRATGGLELRNLVLADSGEYTLTIIPSGGQEKLGKTTLKVYDKIKDVRIEASKNTPKEGYPYMLTCNVYETTDNVYWIRNGRRLHKDNRVVFTVNNKTITFNPLKRNDTGHYNCMAVNALGNMTSPPHKLLVNYGPDTPVISGPEYVETGQSATFNCSAMSQPPGRFSWWFNGTEVADTSVFTSQRLSLNMSREYTCMAYNHVMGKNSTSSKMVTVIEAIESVVVHNHTVPIDSENLTLTCDVTGPYDVIYWMKDNVHLPMNTSDPDPHTYPDMYKNTTNNRLHFTPVTTKDDGTYQCFATNKAGHRGSPHHMLLVNYGPLSVNITGPNSEKPGISVSLRCSADSRPDCDFYWFFNNTSSAALKTGPVITFSATKENEGNYTCVARNLVTNITTYNTKAFTGHASAIHFSSRGGLMLTSLFALFLPVLFN